MLLVEGVAFAVGALLVAGSAYVMAIEAIRKDKRSRQGSPAPSRRTELALGDQHVSQSG
jgi:hypothetical protein